MYKIKINSLRDEINAMMNSADPDRKKLLELSQELDILILQSMYKDKYVKMILGETLMNEFDKFLNKIQIFEKMYQTIRIVDPLNKKVLTIKGQELCDADFNCYDFWEKQKLCENCISMRAYNEDDTIFKLDHKADKIFLITSIPVSIKSRRLIAELVKDVTNSMYIKRGNADEYVKILTSIEHMNQLAVRDDLTDVNNRRYINERLPIDLLSSSLQNKPLSLIFADIDYFKNINDLYGHSAGDEMLREFAAEIRKYIRKDIDWVVRYGGDEFIICLPGTDKNSARQIAERIRINIGRKNFNIAKKNENSSVNDQTENTINVKVSCSFGIHTVDSWNRNITVEEVIDAVDKKLYEAKKSGRNKVV